MVELLDIRHGNKILLFLLERCEIKKTDLLEIMSSSDSLSRSLHDLIDVGLIESETTIHGRKVILTKLTLLGRRVAKQLKKANDILVDFNENQNYMTKSKKGANNRTIECFLCGFENPENAKFCMECEAKLRLYYNGSWGI